MNLLCAGPATTANQLQHVLYEQAKKLSESVPSPVTNTGNTNINQLHVNLAPLKLAVKQNVDIQPCFDDMRRLDSANDQQLCDIIFKVTNEDSKLKSSDESSQLCHKNLTVLMGPHGSGKTTVCLSMISQLVNKKLFPTVNYIFYIPFHQIPFGVETDFLTFVLRCCSCSLVSSDEHEKLIKRLKNGLNVIFIFDDFEISDASFHLSAEQTCMESDLYIPNKPSLFINGLLSGTIFSNAKKVVTGSPSSISKIASTFLPGCIVEVLGLSSLSQMRIGKEICGEKSDPLLQMLTESEEVSLFCRNPLLCVLLKSVVASNCSREEAIPLTLCFIQTMKMYLCSLRPFCNKSLSNTLITIGSTAWRKFKQENSSSTCNFSQVKNISLNSGQLSDIFFSRMSVNEVTFINSIWKELLAAIYVMTTLTIEEFHKCISPIEKSNWKFMSRFLFGLHNPSVQTELKEIFSPIVFELQEEKCSILTSFIIKSLAASINSEGTCCDVQKFLQICDWLYEICSNKIMDKINPLLPDCIQLNGIMKPQKLLGLQYVLEKVDECICIKFGSDIEFPVEGLNDFLSSMEKVHQQHLHCQFTHKDVRLAMLIELTLLHIHKPVNNICSIFYLCDLLLKADDENWVQVVISSFPDVVYLKGTIPSDLSQISSFISILQKLTKPVTFKFGQDARISEEAFLYLLKGICNPPIKIKSTSNLNLPEVGSPINEFSIEKLDLNDGVCTGEGFTVLEHVLSAFPSQVNCLSLSGTHFNRCDLNSLSRCLHKIERLDLRSCNINSSDLVMFLENISSLSQPLKLLDLQYTGIDKLGLAALSNSIHNIDCAVLDNCRVTTIDRRKEGMLVDPEKSHLIKHLVFTRRIKDKYVIKIIDGLGLQDFDDLTLRECKVTSASMKVIFEKLKARTRLPMLNMELGFNKFGDRGLSYFTGGLHLIEKLSLWDCKITSKGVRVLVKEISSLECPMKKLDLSFNDIGDKGIAAICPCLSKIEQLDLCWCGITSVGIKDLSLAILDLENPIKNLTLDENKFGEEGCLFLVDCLAKIRKLSIRHCDITYDGCLVMKEKIAGFADPKPSVTGVDVKRHDKITATEL